MLCGNPVLVVPPLGVVVLFNQKSALNQYIRKRFTKIHLKQKKIWKRNILHAFDAQKRVWYYLFGNIFMKRTIQRNVAHTTKSMIHIHQLQAFLA